MQKKKRSLSTNVCRLLSLICDQLGIDWLIDWLWDRCLETVNTLMKMLTDMQQELVVGDNVQEDNESLEVRCTAAGCGHGLPRLLFFQTLFDWAFTFFGNRVQPFLVDMSDIYIKIDEKMNRSISIAIHVSVLYLYKSYFLFLLFLCWVWFELFQFVKSTFHHVPNFSKKLQIYTIDCNTFFTW